MASQHRMTGVGSPSADRASTSAAGEAVSMAPGAMTRKVTLRSG